MFETFAAFAAFAARFARYALVGMLISVPTSRAGAQATAAYRRELDSLGRQWRTATAAASKAVTARVTMLSGDTVRVGNLIALADKRYVALARGTLARLSPEVDSAYGVSARELRAHPLVIRADPTDSTAVFTAVADSMGVLHLMSSEYVDARALALSWRNKLDFMMTALAPADFRKWLGATIETSTPTRETWTEDRVQLVLADSRVSRACVRGDLRGCLQALSIQQVPNPAFDLFDDAGQRAIINAHGYVLRLRDPAAYDACMSRNDRVACTNLLNSLPPEALPHPVPASVRQSLVRYALSVGGPGAFTRLVQSSGTAAEGLQAAAGLPADSLVAHWRAAILDARTGSNAIDLGTAVASLAWAGLFAGLSLRSSRWR